MRVIIELETGNAAFEDYGFNEEVARILSDAAERLSERPGLRINLHDANGNHVGTARVEA